MSLGGAVTPESSSHAPYRQVGGTPRAAPLGSAPAAHHVLVRWPRATTESVRCGGLSSMRGTAPSREPTLRTLRVHHCLRRITVPQSAGPGGAHSSQRGNAVLRRLRPMGLPVAVDRPRCDRHCRRNRVPGSGDSLSGRKRPVDPTDVTLGIGAPTVPKRRICRASPTTDPSAGRRVPTRCALRNFGRACRRV